MTNKIKVIGGGSEEFYYKVRWGTEGVSQIKCENFKENRRWTISN